MNPYFDGHVMSHYYVSHEMRYFAIFLYTFRYMISVQNIQPKEHRMIMKQLPVSVYMLK